MEESGYTQDVLQEFRSKFPAGWVYELDWSTPEKAKVSLLSGVGSIFVFRRSLFLNYAKLVLSGDHFVCDILKLDELHSEVAVDLFVPDDETDSSKLLREFLTLQGDIQQSIKLVKHFCSITRARYTKTQSERSLNAIHSSHSSNYSPLVDLLGLVCRACWLEYRFSNGDDYVREVLSLRISIEHAARQVKDDVSCVTTAVIKKLEFLLRKLSYFSPGKRIHYSCDFQSTNISIEEPISFDENNLSSLFLAFLDTSQIESAKIGEWQRLVLGERVLMWHLAFLMRYYTQKTQSLQQVDKVFNLAEEYCLKYERNRGGEKSKDHMHNVVDDYAVRSFRNYMHNSRFSILCSANSVYTYEDMKSGLERIRAVQNETFIFNYHPFQKALEYTLRYLESKLSGKEEVEKDQVKLVLRFLQECYESFKINVKWCESYQPYLMQMCFCFCRKDLDFPVFYPSSFCRPLDFQKLNDEIVGYREKISHLEYHIDHIDERNDLIRAHKKIDNLQKNNMEVLGLFTAVNAFFVGLLSIFIGNDGEVSIFDKMEYVIALALILVVFISLGYFVVSNIEEFWKRLVFGFALVAASVVLYCLLAN